MREETSNLQTTCPHIPRHRYKNRKQCLGQIGEKAVAKFVCELGMQVLAQNWRCAAGELDLIVKDGQTLAAVEVKTRSGTSCGHALEAVSQQKIKRLRKLITLWAKEQKLLNIQNLRIDCAAVHLQNMKLMQIDYLKAVSS